MSPRTRAAIDIGGLLAPVGALYIAARVGLPYAWPVFYVVGGTVALALLIGLTGAGVSWTRRMLAALRGGGVR